MPASFRLGWGEVLQSRDERLTLQHLGPSPSLSDPPYPSLVIQRAGAVRSSQMFRLPSPWAVWSCWWLSQQEPSSQGGLLCSAASDGAGWLYLVGLTCGSGAERLRPGEEVPKEWGNGPPVPVLHYGLGPCSLSQQRRLQSCTCCKTVGAGRAVLGEGAHPVGLGRGHSPRTWGLLDGTVTPRAEAASVSGPVAGQGGSVPVFPDHLPGSVSRYLGAQPQACP